MTRILYDYQTFALQQYGGISRYFCELALRVHRSSQFDVSIVAPVHFNDYLRECDVPKAAIHVPLLFPRSQRLYRAINRATSPIIARSITPALVHRTYYEPLSRPGKAPVVVTVYDMIHEIFADTFSSKDKTSDHKRISLACADHILSISDCTANDLVRLLGIPRDKISVTRLGFSGAFSPVGPAGETAPLPRPYILYVGHRGGYKNFDVALRAYASSPTLHRNFDLAVFGGPPLDDRERGQIEALGLRRSQIVRLGGSDAQLARTYRHARAFVYPSMYEGFGIPPLEAMGSGCPVASSNTSSIPEVVGTAAVMFDPSDVDAARAALEKACLDEGARAVLIAAGFERARLFSWDRCAAETIEAYRHVLGVGADGSEAL